MRREQQVSKARRDGRRSARRTTPARPADGQRSRTRRRPGSRGGTARVRKPRPLGISPPVANLELYRPLKKPITLRLDADVLAWFKREGRRYQTRINQALRKVMEREMKGVEK